MNEFKFNGTLLSHQPTSHKWVDKDILNVDGAGHAIYPAYREYELQWDFLSASEFAEIYAFFSAIGQTGTVVSSLPRYAGSNYEFAAYSGTVLREPRFQGFFEGYYENTSLLIVRIRT